MIPRPNTFNYFAVEIIQFLTFTLFNIFRSVQYYSEALILHTGFPDVEHISAKLELHIAEYILCNHKIIEM